jgi:hypothetical protein
MLQEIGHLRGPRVHILSTRRRSDYATASVRSAMLTKAVACGVDGASWGLVPYGRGLSRGVMYRIPGRLRSRDGRIIDIYPRSEPVVARPLYCVYYTHTATPSGLYKRSLRTCIHICSYGGSTFFPYRTRLLGRQRRSVRSMWHSQTCNTLTGGEVYRDTNSNFWAWTNSKEHLMRPWGQPTCRSPWDNYH